MSSDPVLGMSKDLAKIARRLRRQGWTIEATRQSHVRWTSPTGNVVITGATPAPPTMRRVRGQLARAAQEKKS